MTFHFRRDRLVAVILIISFSVILDGQVLLELVSDILLTGLLSRIEEAVLLLALFWFTYFDESPVRLMFLLSTRRIVIRRLYLLHHLLSLEESLWMLLIIPGVCNLWLIILWIYIRQFKHRLLVSWARTCVDKLPCFGTLKVLDWLSLWHSAARRRSHLLEELGWLEIIVFKLLSEW